MKKIIIIIGLLTAGFCMKAQDQQAYIKAMTDGLQKLGSAQSIEDLQAATSVFERISNVAKEDWYAAYYASLGYTRMSMMAKEISEKDAHSEKALKHVKHAIDLAPNNSEVRALEGFVYMAQLAADPNSRGQMLSGKIMQTYGEALRLNEDNPRAIALMAQMKYGMAQFFGSPTEEACGMAKGSLALFEAEEKGKSFAPTWGANVAEGMIAQCNK